MGYSSQPSITNPLTPQSPAEREGIFKFRVNFQVYVRFVLEAVGVDQSSMHALLHDRSTQTFQMRYLNGAPPAAPETVPPKEIPVALGSEPWCDPY